MLVLANVNMAKERSFFLLSVLLFTHMHMFIEMHTHIYIAFLKDNSFHSEHTIHIVANESSVPLKSKSLRDKDFCRC